MRMNHTIDLTDKIIDYLYAQGMREHPVLARCRTETAGLGGVAIMQIAPEQGAFMAMLARLIGAKRIIEVGVFTGYSSLAVALALPDEGRIIACDVSEEWTGRAKGYWAEAGQAHKIALKLAPAVETLDGLLSAGEAGRFDMAFIDADKSSYDAYYERLLQLLRPGGLILLDNMLWSGAVTDLKDTSPDTVALRTLNAKIKSDERVDMALLPVGDGVMMARKR
jgi:predicted O-methyltransferase YrrM